MNSVLSRMIPRAIIAAVLAAGATAPLAAAPGGGAYVATLAAPLVEPRQEILGGVLWKCAADRCTGPVEGGRPVLVCQQVARKFGPVATFRAPRGDLVAPELARCNDGE